MKRDETTPTLLPCPFCGCPDVVIFYDHPESVGPIAGGGHYISHPLWNKYPDTWKCEAIPNRGYFGSEQEAIAAWNRRAPAALAEAAPAPEGEWQTVPKRATEAMIEAHFKAHAEATTVFAEVQSVWAHMLAAAPERIVGAAK